MVIDTVIAEAVVIVVIVAVKPFNRDRKRNTQYHGTTPGSSSNKLEWVLVS